MNNFAFVDELDKPQEKSNAAVENVINSRKIENINVYAFDEAVELTKVGIYHYFVQIVCGLCLMAITLDLMGGSIIIPFFKRDIPSTIAEQGLFASSAFLGSILSSHACGFLSDTWGRVKMLRTSVALSFVTSFISVFCVNIWTLTVLRFLNGLIISSCQAIVYSFLGEFHSNKTRTRYITMLSMFLPMGMMAIPALGLAILPLQLNWTLFGMAFSSWRLFLLLCCLLRIFPLIGLFITPESPKYVLIQGDHEEALNTLRTMFVKNTRRSKCEYPVQQMSVEISGGALKNVSGVNDAMKLIWTPTAQLFQKNRALHTINLCLMMFLIFWIANGLFLWLPVILNADDEVRDGNSYTTCEIMYLFNNRPENITKVDDTDEDEVIDTTMFTVMIIIGAVFTVTYFIFSSIINFIGKKNLMFCWVLTSGASCLIIQYLTNYTWSVIVFNLIRSLNSCRGIVSTVATEFFPTNISAMGMCLIMLVARIGSFAGGNFVGFMMYAHCDMMLSIYLGLCVFLANLTLVLPSGDNKEPKIIE